MITDITLELASSWSLRSHYSRDLTDRRFGRGREGHAICSVNTTVYDDDGLLSFDPSTPMVTFVSQDRATRPMCKRCERLGSGK